MPKSTPEQHKLIDRALASIARMREFSQTLRKANLNIMADHWRNVANISEDIINAQIREANGQGITGQANHTTVIDKEPNQRTLKL